MASTGIPAQMLGEELHLCQGQVVPGGKAPQYGSLHLAKNSCLDTSHGVFSTDSLLVIFQSQF